MRDDFCVPEIAGDSVANAAGLPLAGKIKPMGMKGRKLDRGKLCPAL